jgi:predicted RNA-binding Zn-ribbon protein involved in translation (DUF1610 family)
MQVQLRQKRSKGQRRGRVDRAGTPERGDSAGTSPATAERGVAARRVDGGAAMIARSERPSGEPLRNDRALYTCQCGYVFQAPVSTSVGCPNCGDTQAW